MPARIRITAGKVIAEADLDESLTAKAILKALPIEGEVNRWGEEIYFEIPVKLAEAPEARQQMAVGELAYWPVGAAFCIFFGRTPASRDENPRAYSNVNPFGAIDGDAKVFGTVRDGEAIRIERA
jgi:uncharacterized protein